MKAAHRWKWGIAASVAAVLATIVCGTASADSISSMRQAVAQNDPAAEAQVMDTADDYIYEGDEVSGDFVQKNQLACVQTSSEMECYDDAATAGGGLWYPGNTGYCRGNYDLRGTGWNNRIRSRMRY